MCRRIVCPQCKKPSYAGCGKHVEEVLGDVPPAERCRCASAQAVRPGPFATLAQFVRGKR